MLRRDELAGARERLPGQLAEALARIHSIDAGGLTASRRSRATRRSRLRALGGGARRDRRAAAGRRGRVCAGCGSTPPPPVERRRSSTATSGSATSSSTSEGLAAVIDWELCHAGDPAEDIGWICDPRLALRQRRPPDRRARGSPRSSSTPTRRPAAARPEPERLRWWEAMGNVKWAIICGRQAADHLTGRRPSAELASLGRRICEPEWDLLELIESGLIQDRPTAPELLDALAEMLFTEVREWVPRERRFQILVAANLCAVVARELRAGEEPSRAGPRLFRRSSARRGTSRPPRTRCRGARRASGARRARDPRGRARRASSRRSPSELREHVRRKLEIARPGYAADAA